MNGSDENGKCRECGSRGITYSTEKNGDGWIWKKVCSSCRNELEKQTLKLSWCLMGMLSLRKKEHETEQIQVETEEEIRNWMEI